MVCSITGSRYGEVVSFAAQQPEYQLPSTHVVDDVYSHVIMQQAPPFVAVTSAIMETTPVAAHNAQPVAPLDGATTAQVPLQLQASLAGNQGESVPASMVEEPAPYATRDARIDAWLGLAASQKGGAQAEAALRLVACLTRLVLCRDVDDVLDCQPLLTGNSTS